MVENGYRERFIADPWTSGRRRWLGMARPKNVGDSIAENSVDRSVRFGRTFGDLDLVFSYFFLSFPFPSFAFSLPFFSPLTLTFGKTQFSIDITTCMVVFMLIKNLMHLRNVLAHSQDFNRTSLDFEIEQVRLLMKFWVNIKESSSLYLVEFII